MRKKLISATDGHVSRPLKLRSGIIHSISVLTLGVALLTGCSQDVEVQVGLNWVNETQVENDGSWYLGISHGKHVDTWSECMEPFASREVEPGVARNERFLLPDESQEYLTAFIFCDQNENEQYDADHDVITGFKSGSRNLRDIYHLQLSAHH